MKKSTLIFTLGLFFSFVALMSCKSEACDEACQKAKADSIAKAKADSAHVADSLAAAHLADSLAAAAYADSVRIADSLAAISGKHGGSHKPAAGGTKPSTGGSTPAVTVTPSNGTRSGAGTGGTTSPNTTRSTTTPTSGSGNNGIRSAGGH